MYKLVNTSGDRSKAMLWRKAAKFDPEPYFNGTRLRQGMTMLISDEQYEFSKEILETWKRNGAIDIFKVSDDPSIPELSKEPPVLDPPVVGTVQIEGEPIPGQNEELLKKFAEVKAEDLSPISPEVEETLNKAVEEPKIEEDLTQADVDGIPELKDESPVESEETKPETPIAKKSFPFGKRGRKGSDS